MPRNLMLMTEEKFGVNPTDKDLRCVGTVELGSHLTGPKNAPIDFIKHSVTKAFSNLSYSGTEEWLGFRPTTPDSITLVGEIGNSGIYTNFGHQHLGLTVGPKTGRLIAQLIGILLSNMPHKLINSKRNLV